MVSHKKLLQTLREEHGMSQLELAEQLGVSRQTVSRWEAGQIKPSADNLLRLSQLWGVPVDALLKDDWAEEKAPEIQVVEVPVEVPVSRPICRPLIALLAALILIAGIVIGALFFQKRDVEAVPPSTSEGEVISSSGEDSEEVIPESELDVSEIDPSTVIYGSLLPPLPGSSEPN